VRLTAACQLVIAPNLSEDILEEADPAEKGVSQTKNDRRGEHANKQKMKQLLAAKVITSISTTHPDKKSKGVSASKANNP
jgi:hypothetical protein